MVLVANHSTVIISILTKLMLVTYKATYVEFQIKIYLIGDILNIPFRRVELT